MKALHELNNMEKGKLLADLFPHDIADILEAMVMFYCNISEFEESFKATWNNPLISANSWFNLAKESASIISKKKQNMVRSSRVFCEQLFYGYLALYTVDCITKFAEISEDRPKLKLAVELLFHP